MLASVDRSRDLPHPHRHFHPSTPSSRPGSVSRKPLVARDTAATSVSTRLTATTAATRPLMPMTQPVPPHPLDYLRQECERRIQLLLHEGDKRHRQQVRRKSEAVMREESITQDALSQISVCFTSSLFRFPPSLPSLLCVCLRAGLSAPHPHPHRVRTTPAP